MSFSPTKTKEKLILSGMRFFVNKSLKDAQILSFYEANSEL